MKFEWNSNQYFISMSFSIQNTSAISGAKLRNFFSNTNIYAHNPQKITFLQTHASYVFIAKPWVYKVKKPVDFGFLDYSTLEKRLIYCFREVELNSRLCPEIYDGVIPIYLSKDALKLGLPLQTEEAPRDAAEFAVKMKYLPHKYFLSSKINNEGISSTDIQRICKKLYHFYHKQKGGQDLSKWGEIKHLRVSTDENFDQTKPFQGDLIPSYLYEIIKSFTNNYYEVHEHLFRDRIEKDCIIDGHGDLHLDHIHITDDHVCIYDCIEFNDRLRYQDWANDLAFLAMDLDFRGEPQRQAQLITEMSRLLDDKQMQDIIDFYKCYRAYVRGKVSALQLNDTEITQEQESELKQKAKQYFGLSGRYAVIGSKPTALIIMGRIATGKSTISKKIAELFSIQHYSSDRTRKKLAGISPEETSPKELESQLYSKDMSHETYTTLFDKALEQLRAHQSVILDATFSRAEKRKRLIDTLEDSGFNYIVIQAQSSDQLIKKRLEKRMQTETVVSDARLEHFDALNDIFQPPEEIPSKRLIEVDTSQDIDETLNFLFKQLSDKNIHQ